MPGEQHGYDLIPDLSLVHGLAVLVASHEQQGKEIAAVLTAQPALGNDLCDQLIDPPQRPAITYVAGNGYAVRDEDGPAQTGRDFGHQYIGRLLDGGDIPLDAGPEECPGSNLQCQRHDLGVNIQSLARFPTSEHGLGVTDHDRAIACQPLAAESRRV